MRLSVALVTVALTSSRRAADALIAAGSVIVNGQVMKDYSYQPAMGDVLSVADQQRTFHGRTKAELVAMYKPHGYVVSRRPQSGQQSIYQLLPNQLASFQPIGRLDIDSEGLLLLTNDGSLNQTLSHPSHGQTKIYQVTVREQLTDAHFARLRTNMTIDGVKVQAKQVAKEDDHSFTIAIEQGLNRQVRKMAGQAGLTVMRLVRTQVGPYRLGTLQPGQWRAVALP